MTGIEDVLGRPVTDFSEYIQKGHSLRRLASKIAIIEQVMTILLKNVGF